jgi:hypothetical protein
MCGRNNEKVGNVASCRRSSSSGRWRSGSDTVSERAGGVVSEVTPHSPSLALGGHAKFWNLTYHTHAEPAPPLTSPYLYVALSSCPVLLLPASHAAYPPTDRVAYRSPIRRPRRSPLARQPIYPSSFDLVGADAERETFHWFSACRC